MEYIDITPTWQEILPTWRFMVEACLEGRADNPLGVMQNFWAEMDRMAQAADAAQVRS